MNNSIKSLVLAALIAVSAWPAPLFGQLRLRAKTQRKDTVALIFTGAVDRVADKLRNLRLSRGGVTIIVSECGGANAGYSPSSKTIVMCTELGDTIFARAAEILDTARAKWAVINTAQFIALHEVGHAVAHSRDLPVVGREEDAADQFAAVTLARWGEMGRAMSAAFFLRTMSWEESADSMANAHVHPASAARESNIVCWAVGAGTVPLNDPAAATLPSDRRAQCDMEWRQITRAWTRLLEK